MSNKSRRNSASFDSAATEREALRRVRLKRADGVTFRELGELLEVDPSWVSKWEKGEISDPGIHRIGRVLERLS